MLIPSAIFILASYTDPVGVVDPQLSVRRQQEEMREAQFKYADPAAPYPPRTQKKQKSALERAAEGRMVVPKKFR